MNEIRIFEHEKFGNVRAVEIDGEPWFVGKDVAVALGYLRPKEALATNVDSEDKIMGVSRVAPIPDSLGRIQYPTMINESGLYSLTFGSKLPEAKAFKHWVTSEVLPSIRKTGSYSAAKANPYSAMIPQDYPSALRALADECEKNQRLEDKIALDAPKVTFAESVEGSASYITVGELAKILKQNGVDIGRNRLYNELREMGYLMKYSTEPTQLSMEKGFFYIEKRIDKFGRVHVLTAPKITPQGQLYFVNLFINRYARYNQLAMI